MNSIVVDHNPLRRTGAGIANSHTARTQMMYVTALDANILAVSSKPNAVCGGLRHFAVDERTKSSGVCLYGRVDAVRGLLIR